MQNIPNEAGQLLNRWTGYDQCERLKEAVNAADRQFQDLRERLQTSRITFTKAIAERSLCQKELNGLLQRKPGWLDTDLQRFTELYRTEMRLEGAERAAKEENEQLEKQVDQAHHNLVSVMRERYQEEQLWSDKIRRASTAGTFGLMAVNIALFLGLQLWVEPRKRKRFIEEFESVVAGKLQDIPVKSVVIRQNDKQLGSYQSLLIGAATLVLMNGLILVNFR